MRSITLSLSLALAAPLVLAAAALAAEGEPVQAVWQESEIDFVYLGRTSFYSCDSIEHKIERILKELGAREDVQARASGCTSWFTPERFMNVRIKVALPVATVPGQGLAPEERSRRELVARVRGESPVDVELAAQFGAEWKRVTFSRRSRYLEDGDCELLEQLESRVLRKLDLRIVREDNWCIPGQVRFGALNLEVDALVALPKPDDAQDALKSD